MSIAINIKNLFYQNKTIITDLLVAVFIILASVFYFCGINKVPFHPDESAQIFMSSDFDIFFTTPRSLFWSEDKLNDLHQHYRELDAPLTRSLIGLGRWITHSSELNSDWDWSASWQSNISAGALPSDHLLLVARLSVAALFPLSLIFLYLNGIKLQNRITGFVAILLFSTNSLVLLHTRRAMAESALLFFLLLGIYFLFRFRKKVWLCAIPIALVFNSKQTSFFLIPTGLFAIVWQAFNTRYKARTILVHFFLFSLLLVSITLLVNPFLWANPIHAVINAIESRIDLTNAQVKNIYQVAPAMLLNTPMKRFAGLIGNLFIQKPATQDIANYVDNLRESTMIYMRNPIHSLFRSYSAGSILLFLSIFGCSIGVFDVIKKSDRNKNLIIFLVLTVLAVVQYLATIQIPYQRYVIIFVPITVLWIGFFISKTIAAFHQQKRHRLNNHSMP